MNLIILSIPQFGAIYKRVSGEKLIICEIFTEWNKTNKTGIILKGIGGFYTVMADGVSYTCKARGLFRKQHITPTVGDKVEFGINADGENGYLLSICERKNLLVRPAVANIDKLFIVVAASRPEPPTAPPKTPAPPGWFRQSGTI